MRALLATPWTPLLGGFVLWSIAFIALYSVQGVGCAFGWDAFLHRTILIAIFAGTLAAHTALLLATRPRDDGFVAVTGFWASAAALAASTLVYATVLFVSACV